MTVDLADLAALDAAALRSLIAGVELELQRRAAWTRYAAACGSCDGFLLADQAVFDAAWSAFTADRDAFLRRWHNVIALQAIAAKT